MIRLEGLFVCLFVCLSGMEEGRREDNGLGYLFDLRTLIDVGIFRTICF